MRPLSLVSTAGVLCGSGRVGALRFGLHRGAAARHLGALGRQRPAPLAAAAAATAAFAGGAAPPMPLAQHYEALAHDGVLADLRPAEAAARWAGGSEDAFGEAIAAVVRDSLSASKLSAWVALPIELARFAAVAARHDFGMHHADADGLVMYKWLGAGPDKVGCAGFVLNAKGELLVVKEWTRTPDSKGPAAQWKLPGGLADSGETLLQCAAREVFEETGAKCAAAAVVAFWHRHDLGPWGLSDVYCVVRMDLDDSADLKLTPQPDEIAEAKWYDLRKFVREQNHPLILKVAKQVYGIDKDSIDDGSPILPKAHFEDLGVQWPGRPVFPTYFAKQQAPLNLAKQIRAVASDVDGTLLTSGHELHNANAEAILELFPVGTTAVRFFIATGKCRAGARAALPAIRGHVDDGVFVNGLVVYAGDTVIFERLLDVAVLRDVVAFARTHQLDVVAYCRDDLLCLQTTPQTDSLADLYHEPRPRQVEDLASFDVNKVLLLAPAEKLAAARHALGGLVDGRAGITTAMPTLLEVLPFGASKREGVQAFCEHFGICEDTELLAVGDGENDADMLKHAAVGVAMGNAGIPARLAADVVVRSNDDAGASVAFRIAAALARGDAVNPSAF